MEYDGYGWDECLTRLEDALARYPFDRALPDLPRILDDAAVTEEFLRGDERALKVLHEAVMARPLSSVDAVGQLRTEVELLTLEVEVLTARLQDPDATTESRRRAAARLAEVGEALGELRRVL